MAYQSTIPESVGPHMMDYESFVPTKQPLRHKRKVPFRPYPALPTWYRGLVSEIRRRDYDLDQYIISSRDYIKLAEDAYASNVHWTTRIEGNPLSQEDVAKITGRFSSGRYDETNPGNIQEIINHLYPMFVTNPVGRMPTLKTAEKVHTLLMEGTGFRGIPGELRDVEVSVQTSGGEDLFICCPPAHVREESESLFDWLMSSPFDPVCTAALFFHEFESIHPFLDGNGRTGRTLMRMVLQAGGFGNCALCRFEEKMLKRNNVYYDLLAYTDETGDYTPFVCYTAEALLQSYTEANELFSQKDLVKDMDEVSRTLAYNAKDYGTFTLADARVWIPSVSDQTLRNRLNGLEGVGILRKDGHGKGMSYAFNDPFAEVKGRVAARMGDILS